MSLPWGKRFPMKTFEKDGKLMVIVERGQKLVAAITEALKMNRIEGGLISGLGALTDAELGYYYLHKREYLRKTFTDEYELISLTGNATLKDGAPFVHVHAVLGDDKFNAFGGHLFEAVSAVTAEVSIIPFPFAAVREPNPDVGLATICSFR
jgi:uncharacterized protein